MILLFLLISSSFAVTEKDIIQSVTTHFPLVEEARLKYKASQMEVIAGQGAFDHKLQFKARNRLEDKYDNHYFETSIERFTPYHGLGLIAGHRQGRGTFPPYDGKLETSGAGEIFAGITFPFLRNFQTDEFRSELKINKLSENIAQAELELKKAISIHKALSLYNKFLFLNQKIKIRKKVFRIAEKRRTMLEKKLKAGDIEKIKLLDNERSIDKRREELTKAEIEWQNIQSELSLYYRDTRGNPILLGNEVYPNETIDPPTFIGPPPENLPQISIVENELKILEVRKKFYRQSKLPGLNLDLTGYKELSANDPFDPYSIQIGVKFDFPIENRKATGKTVAGEYKYRALLKQKDYLLQQLTRQFNYAQEAVKLNKKRWDLTTSELEKTALISQAERRRWTQGASDLYIVNLREQDEAETNIKRWYIWLEYQQHLLDARLYSGNLVL